MPHVPDLSGSALDDRYELHAVIGEGAFGRVYEGRDRRLERPVAVKVIKPWWAEDPSWVSDFERETRLLARISDPGSSRSTTSGTRPRVVTTSRSWFRREPGAAAAAWPDRAVAGGRHRRAAVPGAGRRARPADRPPRRQAAEHPADELRTGEGRRLRRRRAGGGLQRRRLADDRRHALLHGARAEPRPPGLARHRRLQRRRRPLRDGRRGAAVRGRLGGRAGALSPAGPAAAVAGERARAAAADHRASARQGPVAALCRRRRDGRRAGGREPPGGRAGPGTGRARRPAARALRVPRRASGRSAGATVVVAGAGAATAAQPAPVTQPASGTPGRRRRPAVAAAGRDGRPRDRAAGDHDGARQRRAASLRGRADVNGARRRPRPARLPHARRRRRRTGPTAHARRRWSRRAPSTIRPLAAARSQRCSRRSRWSAAMVAAAILLGSGRSRSGAGKHHAVAEDRGAERDRHQLRHRRGDAEAQPSARPHGDGAVARARGRDRPQPVAGGQAGQARLDGDARRRRGPDLEDRQPVQHDELARVSGSRADRFRIVYSVEHEKSCTLLIFCSRTSVTVTDTASGAQLDDFDLSDGTGESQVFATGPGSYQIRSTPPRATRAGRSPSRTGTERRGSPPPRHPN